MPTPKEFCSQEFLQVGMNIPEPDYRQATALEYIANQMFWIRKELEKLNETLSQDKD